MIAAAGSGTRLGAGGPKALVGLAGRPLLAWSLEAAGAAEAVGPIVVAAPPGHEAEIERLLAGRAAMVTGGRSRSESVALALARVETELLVVHDAARPLVEPSLFDAVLGALEREPDASAAIAAAALTDTVKRAATDQPRLVGETLSRPGLWAAQTPQAFRAEALRAALDVTAQELAAATDDAMLVERAGGRVLLEPAPRSNLKVTSAADLRLAELLLRARGG